MPDPQSSCGLSTTVVALANALVESVVHPAVIVRDASDVVAVNPKWLQLLTEQGKSQIPRTLEGHKTWFDGINNLTEDLRASSASDGSRPLVVTSDEPENGREFIARWRRLGLVDGSADHLTLVLLEDHADACQRSATVRTEKVRLDELLVRQAVVEEQQRRLLGTALHDHVSQILAHARRCLASEGIRTEKVTEAISLVDEAILAVRDLTFAISPPILEDLGLLPALRWLVDDLNRRYQVEASFVDDGKEPILPPDARTIAFRAVRELTNNAVKHAPGAEVVISSLANQSVCRLTVRDFGPGFDRDWAAARPDGRASYGLLSVQQQILALGGSFEVVSVLGEGTRVVLTLPLAPSKVQVKPAAERVSHA